MPTYQYKCRECGIVFERFQHFSEEPVRVCPECDGPVQRVIQPVGIIFKGKGFYVTDNKGSSSPTIPKSQPDNAGDDATEKATGSEAKSADKTPKPAAPKETD